MSSIEKDILGPIFKNNDDETSQKISENIEEIDAQFLKLLQSKIDFCVGSIIAIVRAVEKKYGEEGYTLCKKAWTDWQNEEWKKLGSLKNEFRTFIELLEKSCVGTNDFKRVVEKDDYIGYNFTRCMWADAFRKMTAPDIGNWLCESDYVFPKAFNKNMDFKRTKTLMEGSELCDHIYYLKKPKRSGRND